MSIICIKLQASYLQKGREPRIGPVIPALTKPTLSFPSSCFLILFHTKLQGQEEKKLNYFSSLNFYSGKMKTLQFLLSQLSSSQALRTLNLLICSRLASYSVGHDLAAIGVESTVVPLPYLCFISDSVSSWLLALSVLIPHSCFPYWTCSQSPKSPCPKLPQFPKGIPQPTICWSRKTKAQHPVGSIWDTLKDISALKLNWISFSFHPILPSFLP